MHIKHILHILLILRIKTPDVVWECHVRRFHSCSKVVEATGEKDMMHRDIRTETVLSYPSQAEQTESRIDRIRQRYHALLFPIWMHCNPGCDFHHQPECVSGFGELWRGSKCWCEFLQSPRSMRSDHLLVHVGTSDPPCAAHYFRCWKSKGFRHRTRKLKSPLL